MHLELPNRDRRLTGRNRAGLVGLACLAAACGSASSGAPASGIADSHRISASTLGAGWAGGVGDAGRWLSQREDGPLTRCLSIPGAVRTATAGPFQRARSQAALVSIDTYETAAQAAAAFAAVRQPAALSCFQQYFETGLPPGSAVLSVGTPTLAGPGLAPEAIFAVRSQVRVGSTALATVDEAVARSGAHLVRMSFASADLAVPLPDEEEMLSRVVHAATS